MFHTSIDSLRKNARREKGHRHTVSFYALFHAICAFALGAFLTLSPAIDATAGTPSPVTIHATENITSETGFTAEADTTSETDSTSESDAASAENSSAKADASAVTNSAPETNAPSVVLMDADTGTILYAKDELTERPLASVTKVMTLLLIFDAISNNQIALDDTVTVSEHAASMGGSQVYLEPDETQTVETMIKCITVASANDACVAMAEFISGSEDAFVEQMNAKAAELGMEHTHFVNSCGLDADGHYSCALDIALMSQALTLTHPEIFDYTSIWMEDITHHTAKGDSTFTLSSTNKLMKQYAYATGLKTGSTSNAKFCLAATATKDDVNLIAAIMAADDSKQRIADAISLFDWGFANCRILSDENTDTLANIPVTGGVADAVPVSYSGTFRYLDTTGSGEALNKTFDLPESLAAPVNEGDIVGQAIYTLGETQIGTVDIVASESVREMTFRDALAMLAKRLFLGRNTTYLSKVS